MPLKAICNVLKILKGHTQKKDLDGGERERFALLEKGTMRSPKTTAKLTQRNIF